MKKLFTLLLIVNLLFSIDTIAQNNDFTSSEKLNRTYENHKGDIHLIGRTSKNALQNAPYNQWFTENYKTFTINIAPLKGLNEKLDGISIKLFMGTWCGDSQREVPKFLKVMETIGMEDSQLSIVNLSDRSPNYKQSPTHEEAGLDIHRVPTFIFYKEEQEIGRIVESPLNSMEIDIGQILMGIPSQPKYRAVTMLNKLFEERGLAYLKRNKESLASQVKRIVKNEYELNTFGYVLLDTKEKEFAITVFEINAFVFPNEPYVYSSLGRAYQVMNQQKLAIDAYEKALELDKSNEKVKEKLEALKKR